MTPIDLKLHSRSGVKIPPLNLNDGPQGFRDGGSTAWVCDCELYVMQKDELMCHFCLRDSYNTVLLRAHQPSGMTVGMTWDIECARAWGVAMGKGSDYLIHILSCDNILSIISLTLS